MKFPRPEEIESAIKYLKDLEDFKGDFKELSKVYEPPIDTAISVLSALKSGELVEPASEEEIAKIVYEYNLPKPLNRDWEGVKVGSMCYEKYMDIAKALVGKVGELVGKDNVDKKMDRLIEAHKKFCERMDRQKYMSVEEVCDLLVTKYPKVPRAEWPRLETFKELAQALTRLPKEVSEEEAIKILRQFRLCRFDYIKDIRSIKPHNLTDEELLEIYTALEGGE